MNYQQLQNVLCDALSQTIDLDTESEDIEFLAALEALIDATHIKIKRHEQD